MTEYDGLRPLKVGVARHYGFAVLLRFISDYLNQVNNKVFDVDDLFFEVELYVKRNLVVAAARGVKPLSVVAYALCQLALDEGVDILRLHVDFKCARFDVGKYTL